MASILAENSYIVEGKRVLELGCGSGGICSTVSARNARLVVATDGDAFALELLAKSVASNLPPPLLTKLITKRLEWGNRNHIEEMKKVSNTGFDVLVGTHVTYIPEAISPLFATASELIASSGSSKDNMKPALILCRIFRRVDEPSLLSAAGQYDFRLADRWPARDSTSQTIISNWLLDNGLKDDLPSTALHVLLFHKD